MTLPQKFNEVNDNILSTLRMMKCKRLSMDDLSRHVPIYRNVNFWNMRQQFRKLHFRKLETQQRTFNHA